jgi:hypothetical protein
VLFLHEFQEPHALVGMGSSKACKEAEEEREDFLHLFFEVYEVKGYEVVRREGLTGDNKP